MPISVTVNSVSKSSGDVVTFADSSTGSPPSTFAVAVTASGGSVTLKRVAIPSWGNRLRVTAGSPTSVAFGTGSAHEPDIVLTSGSTQTLTLGFDTMGSAHASHERGCCYGYLNIVWNDGVTGGGQDQTFRLIFRGAMSDATVPLSYDAAGFAAVVVSGWALGADTPTVDNPLGLGWTIDTDGHLAFVETFVAPQVVAGVKYYFFHQVVGQMFRLLTPAESNTCCDPFTHAAELGSGIVNPLWYTHWDAALEHLEEINPDGVAYCYNGTWREDEDYIGLRAVGSSGAGAFGFVRRFWGEISNYLKHPSVRYCGDVPRLGASEASAGNPEIKPGEARYENQLALTRLLELNGRGEMMTEPRGLDAETHWLASAGFGRCVIDATFRRNNPARYTDAASATTNAHMAGRAVLRWHIDGDPATLAYQIADSLGAWDAVADVTKVVVGLYQYINVSGNDLEDLRAEVNAVLAKLGSVTP